MAGEEFTPWTVKSPVVYTPARRRRRKRPGEKKPRSYDTTGYVYLIGVLEGCHKIGRAQDPAKRLTDLGVLPVPLRLVHAVHSLWACWLEGYLHRAFAHLRARGEWFRLGAKEVELLRGVAHADKPEHLPEVVREGHWRNTAALRAEQAAPPKVRETKRALAQLAEEEPRLDVPRFLERAAEESRKSGRSVLEQILDRIHGLSNED